MNKAHENINWVDYPLVDTPLASVNLNKMDRSIDTIDDRVIALDSTKANAVDVLTSVVDAVLDENTGVITLTRNNGTTITLQTNLNRLATNLRYDSDPTSEHYQQLILSYNTDPITYGYVDLSALITQYEFTDSSIIHFAVTSGVISATIIDGSITAEKLQPNFLADCQTAKAQAESAETGAGASALVSEGWAKGTQNGIQVTSQSPYYHNNAEWFKDQAQSISGGSLAGLSDVELDMVSQGQTIYWDEASQKWVNGTASAGILPKLHIVTESTSSITVTKGTETFTPTLIEAGVYEMDAPEYGTYTVKATSSLGTQTTDVVVDACKIYNVTVYHFTATITVTYPAGAVCTLTKDGTTITATADPETFSVNEVGTYTVAITQDGQTVSDTVTITTDGQAESITLDFAYIVLTIPSSLIGQTVTITDGTSTRTWLADSTTHTFVCILGNYTLSVGSYSTSVNVVAYTTYTAQFTPDGSTITPTDSVQILLNCADIWDKTTYTTIADLIADDTSLLTVLTTDNAIDYLVRSTTFASAITADEDAMAMIGSYDYCADTLIANATWKTAIDGSAYKSSVYNAPNDTRVAGGVQTWLRSANITDKTYTTLAEVLADTTTLATLIASHDAVDYLVTAKALIDGIVADATAMSYIGLNNYCANSLLSDADWLNGICNSTYMESVLNVKVPTMTSDTTPSGVASAKSIISATYPAWKAFDKNNGENAWASNSSPTWVQYEFTSAQKIIYVVQTDYNTNGNQTWNVQASNDNFVSDINTLATYSSVSHNTSQSHVLNNNTAYKYWRLQTPNTYGTLGVVELQFYGREDV